MGDLAHKSNRTWHRLVPVLIVGAIKNIQLYPLHNTAKDTGDPSPSIRGMLYMCINNLVHNGSCTALRLLRRAIRTVRTPRSSSKEKIKNGIGPPFSYLSSLLLKFCLGHFPRALLLFQSQQQSLKLGHGFCRTGSLDKHSGFQFRGIGEKPAI